MNFAQVHGILILAKMTCFTCVASALTFYLQNFARIRVLADIVQEKIFIDVL